MEHTGRPDRRILVIPLVVDLALCVFVGEALWSAAKHGIFNPGAMGSYVGLPYILAFGLVFFAAAVSHTLRNRTGVFFVPLMLAYMRGLNQMPVLYTQRAQTAVPNPDVMGWALEFAGAVTAAVVIGAGMAIVNGRKAATPL